MGHRVDVFFYGSYMNFAVLKEAGIGERPFAVGTINGHALRIAPLANLVKHKGGIVYGILAQLSHDELQRLYQEHARKKLGGVYLPEAVLVSRTDGLVAAALCYISPNMKDEKANPAYVERILQPARAYGFPRWYLKQIESFKTERS